MDSNPDIQGAIDRRGIAAAIASISTIGIAIGLAFPLLSFILDQRAFSPLVIGANAAVAGIASLAAVPFVTPLAARFGVANVMIASALVSAASFAGFFLFDDIVAWFILRITFHGPLTASFILSEFWINSAVHERKRGLVLGIYATVLSAGFGIGPAIIAVTGSAGALPFVIGTIVILLSVIPIAFGLRSIPAISPGGKGNGFVKYIWAVPLATAAVFVFGAVEQSGLPLMPVYGNRLGYTEAQTSLLLVALAAGNMTLQIPLGIISDRIGDRRYVLYACAFVGLAGAIIIPPIAHIPLAIAAILFVWGGVISGMYTVGLAHLGSRLTGSELAQANSAFVFCYCLGMIAGPQVSAAAMQRYEPHGFVWAIGCLFAGYLVLAFWRAHRRMS